MKTTQALADAARDLLANVNTDNDNNGTYAALQAALDAHDKPTIEELEKLKDKAFSEYMNPNKGFNGKEYGEYCDARDAYYAACRASRK